MLICSYENCKEDVHCRPKSREHWGCKLALQHVRPSDFLPRDASAERGYEIACRLSVRLLVCLSVCNV